MRLLYSVLFLFGVFVCSAMPLVASSGGLIGAVQAGCTCHGEANSATGLAIQGRGSSITAKTGETLSLTLLVAHSSQLRAGMNLAVKSASGANAGTLIAGAGSQLISGELTHTSPQAISNGSAAFPFQWTAPTTPGTYTLFAVGNAVNGDGNTTGDAWNALPPITITVEPPTPAAFEISGRIVNPAGAPVAGVLVLAGMHSATTDAAGNYSIRDVANGTYTITPVLQHWIFMPQSQSVTVNGANVSGQNFTGVRLWQVSGTILNSTGAPVANVSIGAFSGTTLSSTATTDAQGNYTLWLVNGSYTIRPSLANWVFEPSSLSVTVSGANLIGQNITGRRLWSVSGVVVNPNNEPVQNVLVRAMIGSALIDSVITNAQGAYSLLLVNGTYTLAFSRPNWAFEPSLLSVTVSGANLTPDRVTGRILMSVRQPADQAISVSLAPHPAREQVLLSYTITSPARIRYEVFSILGERVRHFIEFHEAGMQRYLLPLGNLPSGLYSIRISSDDGVLGTQTFLLHGE